MIPTASEVPLHKLVLVYVYPIYAILQTIPYTDANILWLRVNTDLSIIEDALAILSKQYRAKVLLGLAPHLSDERAI